MLLRIHHASYYTYEPAVRSSEHMMCLQVRDTARQQVVRRALNVEPAQHHYEEVLDEFGNMRTHIRIDELHTQFSAIASALVRTIGADTAPPQTSWEAAWLQAQNQLDLKAYTQPSLYTVCNAELADWTRFYFPPGRSIVEGARALMEAIHQGFYYSPYSTTIQTPVMEVFANRRGVCQDFSHLMLSALRSIGLPARYVSGYLLTQPPPGQEKLIGADASHAWVSVFVPETTQYGRRGSGRGYWYDFCPTNGRWGWESPAPDFVTLAFGRDYGDVSPIRGLLTGGGQQEMRVEVDVQEVTDGDLKFKLL